MLTACSALQHSTSIEQNDRSGDSQSQIRNTFTPHTQLTFSENAHSIVLRKSGMPGSAPIIELTNGSQLELIFETIGLESRQFQITFSHHNPDWSQSGLSPDFFLSGFQSIFVNGGTVSRNTRTNYRQFRYTFPNSDLQFNVSGNFMLRVEDSDTGNLIFTAPFFVSENAGSTRSSVTTIQTPRQQLRTSHIPRVRYQYPDFLEQPLFDLSFWVVQNQFWGRAVNPDETDFSSPDHVLFEPSREQSFIGDYEFRTLQFNEISQTEPRINRVDFSSTMPTVYLSDDAVRGNFIQPERNRNQQRGADQNLSKEFVKAWFRLDHQQSIDSESSIYLVGDFNRWAIQSQDKLSFNEEIRRWETSVVIKPGSYNYKYVLVENNAINDLEFDDRFQVVSQEYHSLIYMHDRINGYYRLLQAANFYSRNSD